MECTCENCVSACKHRPGWLIPGQAEKIAKFLKISLQQLFNTKLEADFWIGGSTIKGSKGCNIFTLIPTTINGSQGKMSCNFPILDICIFLKNNLCEIHEVKPYECSEYLCNGNNDSIHWEAAKAWDTKENQAQIEKLLEGAEK